MTMAIDQQSRHTMGSMEFGNLSYSSGPHFSNPWTPASSAAPSASSFGNHLSSPGVASRAATMSMPYSSLPATSGPVSGSTYSTLPYSNPGILNQSSELRNYDHTYSSAPAATSSYASTSSYAPTASYSQPLAAPQQDSSARRISPPMSVPLPQTQAAFPESMDASRGMVPTRQADITPRNIYGPRGDRGAADSYGFPSTHSASSSISSASGYPHYYSGGSVSGSLAGSVDGGTDGSVTDYSSASESVGPSGLQSRTLPRPSALLGGAAGQMPPAPASMMGSFNSKISSSSQKKHKCKVCDKRFTRPSSLQTHMYSHTGEKPFACEVPGCGRNFSVVSNLRRHRKVHKGDRGVDDLDHGSPEGSWASHE